MSLESVRQYFAQHAPEISIIELAERTARADQAAKHHHIMPVHIAKTLSLKVQEQVVLIVMRGDTRLDNEKLKKAFGNKARMLCTDEVIMNTGHPANGVCPFGLETPLPVYCDVALQQCDEILQTAGSQHSAVRISPHRLAELTNAVWVDVCR